ncbi:MAG: hypothetical protein EOO61_01835 [Hymenobacter sp.]|nr:MAG: hypothetical protein EOO61_01835 [Hymenobacter sp.]
MSRYPQPRPLPLEQQLANLRAIWPLGKVSITEEGLVWTGSLTPTAMSRTYQVRLTLPPYARRPIIEVLEPNLRELAGSNTIIPHLYCQERLHLCLYTPAKGQWNRTMSVAHTLLPWAMLWLYYFEDWLPDRVWRGGGTPHTSEVPPVNGPTRPTSSLLSRLRQFRLQQQNGY